MISSHGDVMNSSIHQTAVDNHLSIVPGPGDRQRGGQDSGIDPPNTVALPPAPSPYRGPRSGCHSVVQRGKYRFTRSDVNATGVRRRPDNRRNELLIHARRFVE